jgi:acetyltransferase-like isoleucine patch superfamily enzyme
MTNFIDANAKISNFAVIEVSTRGTNTHIGAGSVIDDFVKIKHVAGLGDVFIGSNVYINSGTVIYSANGVRIGNDVLIGPNCNIVPVNHNTSDRENPIRLQGYPKSKGGVVIEDDVWLAANVTILDGVVIGKGAIIGAGSVVTKNVEPYTINFGIPSKKVGVR